MLDVCLNQSQLSDYAAGKISSAQQRAVESHLRECRECRAAVARCRPASDSMLRAVRLSAVKQAALHDSAERDPELAAALSAVAALPGGTLPSGARDVAADTGQLIRDYEIQRKLGEGGMGAVYLAIHTKLKKRVAIKLLKADRNQDASAIARFAVEIEAVGKLEHPHIVRALDAGEANGVHFLVMEYLAGIDLARLVRCLGPVGLADACEIVRQAALGLQHAHESHVIHRDVKPSNLMLLPAGKVKLLDLGLAHFRPTLAESQGLTRDNQMLGTLLYVAPEQLSGGGKADGRADIYSLGVTLYELLLGKVPLKQGLMLSVAPADQAQRPEVPPEIWQLAARMTSLERDERPASMLEVVDALRPWTAGADLTGLLQRISGETAFAAQPAVPGQPLTPGGQWMTPAAAGLSDWTPIDVAAPPVATSDLTATATAPVAAATPQPARRTVPTSAMIVAAIAAAGLAVLLIGLSIARYWDDPKETPQTVAPQNQPISTGIAWVEAGHADYQGLLDALFNQGVVLAVRRQTNERSVLRMGENKLAVGDYELHSTSSDWKVPPQPFSVSADQKVTVTPTIEFPFSWSHPQWPARPGEYCEYEGVLWHAGLGPHSPQAELPYQLSLETLGEQMPGGAADRWLKVEVRSQGLTETAILLVDEQAWTRRQAFQVKEGWILGASQSIREGLTAEFQAKAPANLVARFDADRDSLAEMAQRLGVQLPKQRIAVQDALVLIFDARADAAAPIISGLRANLRRAVKFSWESVPTLRGFQPCLVVTDGAEPSAPPKSPDLVEPAESVAQGPPPLCLARSQTIPFNFAKIEVHSPAVIATLKVRNYSRPDDKVAAELPPLEAYANWHQQVRGLREGGEPFDRPKLPEEDGVGVAYQGAIGPLNFRATIRTVGREMVEPDECRWLSVRVESGNNSDETGLLLINKRRYDNGEFAIVRGWWLSQDKVFPFPTDDMGPVEEGLLYLGKQLPTPRLSVHDVLNLMFDAGLSVSPQFKAIRQTFTAIRVESGVEPKRTNEEVQLNKTGATIKADVWTLAPPASGASYRIVRTRRIPFDFASVKVTAKGLALFAEAVADPGAADAGSPSKEELDRLVDFTAANIAEAAKKEPNWRLWSVKSIPGRLWAEYGGQVSGKNGVTVLLLDKGGKIHEVNAADLASEADLEATRHGRAWQSKENKTLFWGEISPDKNTYFLENDSAPNFNVLVESKMEKKVWERSEFAGPDQELIRRTRTLLLANAPVPAQTPVMPSGSRGRKVRP